MDEYTEPPIGREAPSFRAPTSNGQTLDSEAFHGKLAVVLFFLADPGTPDDEQLLDEFDEHLVDFGHERVQLLGVTACSPRDIRARAERRQLTLTLLADPSGTIARSFGVAPEAFDDRPPATVVIDRQGLVAARIPRRSATGHAAIVLDELRALEDDIDAGRRRDITLRPRTRRSVL